MNNNKKEMAVAALKNGIVIDHIPCPSLFKVVNLLGLDKMESSVTIGNNLDSGSMTRKGIIKIALKYNLQTKQPVIKKLERISRPGLRKYTNVENMPRVLNGLGIAVISTSQGVMSDKDARAKNLGGEVLCYIY